MNRIKNIVMAALFAVAVSASLAWWQQSKKYAALKLSLEMAQAQIATLEQERANLNDAMLALQSENRTIEQRAQRAHQRVSKAPSEKVPQAIVEALEAVQQ